MTMSQALKDYYLHKVNFLGTELKYLYAFEKKTADPEIEERIELYHCNNCKIFDFHIGISNKFECPKCKSDMYHVPMSKALNTS